MNDMKAPPDHEALFAVASAQAGCFKTARAATAVRETARRGRGSVAPLIGTTCPRSAA